MTTTTITAETSTVNIFQNVHPTKAQYTFFEDGGHGWLEVPAAEVRALGIAVSAYSYISKDQRTAYLEEDCDLTAFLDARESLDRPVLYTINHLHEDAFIRQLPRYGAPNKGR